MLRIQGWVSHDLFPQRISIFKGVNLNRHDKLIYVFFPTVIMINKMLRLRNLDVIFLLLIMYFPPPPIMKDDLHDYSGNS